MQEMLLKSMKSLLDLVLLTSANTASTGICYQPKAPASLSRLKRF